MLKKDYHIDPTKFPPRFLDEDCHSSSVSPVTKCDTPYLVVRTIDDYYARFVIVLADGALRGTSAYFIEPIEDSE